MNRIMLVEDEEIVAMDIHLYLEELGYQVVARATSGTEALVCAQSTHPDLILMDIKIKGAMDGVDTANKIREEQDIPVILLTAFSDESTLARARASETFGYLIKPIDMRELRSMIEIALYRHRMEKQLRDIQNQHREEAELFQQALIAINSSLNLQEVLDHILTGLQKVVPFDSAAITLIEGDHLKIVALGGTSRHTKQLGDTVGKTEGLFALMENMHSPLVLADAQLHPRYEQWSMEKKDPIHGWMGIPLIAYEHPIGYLMLNSQLQDVYTADHASLAKSFANQAAVAIEKARLFEQVRNGRERLQALTKKLVEIQEAERQYIARELHDEIGQELTGLQFILALGSEGPQANHNQAFKEAQDLVSSLMSKVRELSVNLHPAMLDDLGLMPTLEAHFGRYHQQTGIQVKLKSENMNWRFPAEVELSAYRVVQEALTNVARYAVVKEVDVALFANDTSLFIRIEDFGRGFNMNILKDSAGAFGLAGMRERIFLIGGKFDIFSRPGKGTRITAIIPIANSLERRANDRQGIVSR